MKISLNWIKDFVNAETGLSNQELVQTITMSVCEVEGYEETGTHLKEVVAAEVIEIEQHPDADKLSLVTVNHGNGSSKVVCGASNFSKGDIVPYAGEGVRLSEDFIIKKAKIRGIESCGMLCAEDELGLSDDHSGLMILGMDVEPGTKLSELFPDQVDVVMEIDNKSITHRPDLWGHYGFAREFGAIFRVPVKEMTLDLNSITGEGNGIIDVEVLAGELVPRFTGLSVGEINILESPDWIKQRLFRVGLRAINNMVDLTNYVMLELGQPMHAFDANRIAGKKLIVKIAENGTKLMTLHQKEAELGDTDITICDGNGASVVAGVVGGKDTGVYPDTSAVFLEAANWDPVTVRKTSTRIGLRTDASKRFEKSLDPEMTLLAVQRAVQLMKLTNPDLKVCGKPVDLVNKANKPITIETDTDFICRRLGKRIDENEIVEILEYLGFKITKNESKLTAEVPSYRRTKDVSIPEDLVEEIGRIHGYNNITPKAPEFPIERPVFNLQHRFENTARRLLSENRYHEVVNYPLTCQKTEDPFKIKSGGIMKLLNPVAEHQDQMRTSLLPHFIQTMLDNQKITFDFKIYEFGRLYWKNNTGVLEEPICLMMGNSKRINKTGEAFYQVKHDLLNLFSSLGIGDISWSPLKEDELRHYQHKHISAQIRSGNDLIGSLYSFTPEFIDQFGLKEDVCIAELDFEKMFSMMKTDYHYQVPPKYPAVNFELSLVVPRRSYFQEIREIIFSVSDLVKSVEFLDVYFPKNLDDVKSLSVSIEFRSPDKTLDSDEVRRIQDKVVQVLADKGFKLREA
jgi:phenylalanyl-tRNA synthetase beta chain